MKRALVAAALLAATACGGSTRPADLRHGDLSTGQIVSPPTPAYDGACPIQDETRLVTNAADWAEVWSTVFACTSTPPTMPTIDFAREMLVVVSLGARSSGGYAVAIQSVVVDPGGVLRVQFVEERPGPSCAVTAVITYPVAIARVPRADVSAAFDGQVQVHECGP
jgi:hypothetical protein